MGPRNKCKCLACSPSIVLILTTPTFGLDSQFCDIININSVGNDNIQCNKILLLPFTPENSLTALSRDTLVENSFSTVNIALA